MKQHSCFVKTLKSTCSVNYWIPRRKSLKKKNCIGVFAEKWDKVSNSSAKLRPCSLWDVWRSNQLSGSMKYSSVTWDRRFWLTISLRPSFTIVQLNALKIISFNSICYFLMLFFITGLWPRSNDRILTQNHRK